MQPRSDPNVRPPYVKFERRAVEDRSQTLQGGKYGFKDVDYAKITPIGQKDTVDREVEEWLRDLEKKAEDGRVPYDWPAQFRKAYEFWKSGQEMPVSGTPIKSWSVISPAQREVLLQSGVLAVEDLANISDEAARQIGIGAVGLKQKAQAWLLEARSTGVLVEENAAMKLRLEEQAAELATLAAAVQELKAKQVKDEPQPVERANF